MYRLLPLIFIFSNSLWAGIQSYEGIVKLSNCSGSIVIFHDMPTSHKAIMMTNGHCTSRWGRFIPPNQAVIDKKISLKAQVFNDQMKLYPILASKILYATMTDTDLAFYQLTKSYDELLNDYNIRPLLLDSKPPRIGESVEIISGYWRKIWNCRIDDFVERLQEGKWYFKDSIRFEKDPLCNMGKGSSGAPIVLSQHRLVVGVNNTANTKGKNCTSNNPCEREGNEIYVRKDVRYGQQTYKIYNCITSDFTFNLNQPSCELPR